MTWYYDRHGDPITLEQWVQLHADPEYLIVARDTVGVYVVSTVWLGLDHGFSPQGPPVIFETMVFATVEGTPSGEGALDYTWRYTTEAAAREGHGEAVTLLRATVQEELPGEPS